MERYEDTWLIVPLYNEATVVRQVIQQARRTFPNIVCVDDGSKDDSARQARLAGAHVVTHPINLGQGAALQTGFEYFLTRTNGTYAVTFDADGQHRVEDAVAMRRTSIDTDTPIIFGSRFLDGHDDGSAGDSRAHRNETDRCAQRSAIAAPRRCRTRAFDTKPYGTCFSNRCPTGAFKDEVAGISGHDHLHRLLAVQGTVTAELH